MATHEVMMSDMPVVQPKSQISEVVEDNRCASPVGVEDNSELHCDCRRRQFEVLPGLWVELSADAIIQAPITTNNSCNELLVRAKKVDIFFGKHLLFKGECIDFKGNVRASGSSSIATTIDDLVVSIARITLVDPEEQNRLTNFQKTFGITPKIQETQLLEEEEIYYRQNAVVGTTTTDNSVPLLVKQQQPPKKVVKDLNIPRGKVLAMKCEVPTTTIDFPVCEGTKDCTLRVIIEYYLTSILYMLDLESGKKTTTTTTSISSSLTASDIPMTMIGSLIGNIICRGSSIGSAVGSFFGAGFLGGKKYKKSLHFSPVGNNPICSSPLSKKYEKAGTTGAYAGSIICGSTIGAILGPLGIATGAVTGAIVGSLCGRKLVERNVIKRDYINSKMNTVTKDHRTNDNGDIECGCATEESYKLEE